MKPLPHHYSVRLTGGPTGHARAAVDGVPDLLSAPPLEFEGPGDAWSPEQLLLASVETCFLFTFRVVAQVSKIPFTSLDIAAEGTVDRQDGRIRFTDIVLRPRLTVAPGVDRDRAVRVIEKAEKGCLVTASLATPIRLEPQIVVG
jgi:organic hydroperoxide reductase OsmC/OhrA